MPTNKKSAAQTLTKKQAQQFNKAATNIAIANNSGSPVHGVPPINLATQPLALNMPKQPLFGAPAPYSNGKGWPTNSLKPGTIRLYCYMVATALAQQLPKGFTIYQFAQALVANSNGNPAPASGWGGTASKPGAKALQHARWFATQGWLTQVNK